MAEVLKISGWCRKVTQQGVVYYTKRGSNESRWIHPGLSNLIYSLSKFDNIRYAAYRLSSKLLEVQVILGSATVCLKFTQSVLIHHGFSSPSLVLDSQELREFLLDLYIRATKAKGVFSHHASHEVSTEAMASFIEQILDPNHKGGVTVLGLKTVLAVMTSARLKDRLAFLFREHSDHQARISETGLAYLLSIISRIPEILGEGIMFGNAIVARGVRACLMAGGGRVVTEEVWMAWATLEPPELVWLTTSYRQQASLKVQHGVKCSSCQAYPIMGLRYQCLQCLSYDMCQNCFFIGMSTKGHKPKHPVQEYCYPSTKKEQAKAFFATIANKFKARQNQPKARKKVTRTLTADRSRPNSIQSNKSSQSKLSQLLIRVSPRSSIGEAKSSPRSSVGESKASPVSSGFCSGEESESPSGESSPHGNSHTSDENSPIYEPLIEEPVIEVESPNLEWDDNGIELGDSALFHDKDILEQLDNFENSIFRKDLETGDIMCYQHNTKKVKRDQMDSIIGHLEEDHKKLQTRLEAASPDLVQPVIEAQVQLNRLKDLMHNIFGSKSFLNDSTKEVSERPAFQINKTKDDEMQYHFMEDYKNVEEHRVTVHENDEDEKPAESTRLEVFKNIQTPRVKFRGDNLDNFSPITSFPRIQEEESQATCNGSNTTNLFPPEKFEDHDEHVDNPVITFNCISPLSRSSTGSDDPSLTKYNLSDLSHRMGGTGLYISRDNGLDITDQLDDRNDKSAVADTVDELEKLMLRLSSVFDTFRDPNYGKAHDGDNEAIFGLVKGIDEDLYGILAESKETCI